MKQAFSQNLLQWFRDEDDRKMPWKGEKDPYKIWLSEIILQQTRVEQGLPYYERFITAYPSINILADATDEDVFKLWEGLGYYNRCRHLLFTARYISKHLKGIFPDNYDEILSLKGVGPYTAAAIASFAYAQPYAVTDGNVFRVLSRYFGKNTPIDTTDGKLYFANLAQQLLYEKDSAAFNQAIMDFGAMVCKPKIPKCSSCIFKATCIAFRKGLVNKLPVREKQLKRKTRWFYYFIFSFKDKVFVNRREERDIWRGLYEFYLFESVKEEKWMEEQLQKWMKEQLEIHDIPMWNISDTYTQKLTHQDIKAQFISVHLQIIPKSLKHLKLIKTREIKKLAFPKIINTFLGNNS